MPKNQAVEQLAAYTIKLIRGIRKDELGIFLVSNSSVACFNSLKDHSDFCWGGLFFLVDF